jgi:hypothetical protein
MSKVLDQLPYADERGMVVVAGEQVPVLAHQVIVWVSVSPKGVPRLGADAPRLPAILDTGNSFGFSIAEDQLVRWGGLRPELLKILGPVLVNNRSLNRHAADVWLHRNRRKRRDAFRAEPPFRLELRDGIAIYPTDPRLPAPRLPLLGLRAIDENGLRCTINGSGHTVSMSTTGAA